MLWFVFAVAVWVGCVVFFARAKAWLPYYVIASAGLALIIVVAARNYLPAEAWLKASTAFAVHYATMPLGIQTSTLPADPGSLVVRAGDSWSHLTIGLESSGLLESASIVGLVAFFPANRWRMRIGMVAIALAATFLANTLRVSLIVAAVAWFGEPGLDFVHLILGRVVFFIMAICIYWYVVTRPTLKAVQARI